MWTQSDTQLTLYEHRETIYGIATYEFDTEILHLLDQANLKFKENNISTLQIKPLSSETKITSNNTRD